MTEQQLFEAFAAFQPESARIIEGRGFGFIDVDESQLNAAIDAMNEKEVGGRKLVVNEARPKTDAPRFGGGGGGGGRDRDFRSGGGGGGGGRSGGPRGGGGGRGGRR